VTDIPREDKSSWTFLSNHALVLMTIARDPAARLRDVAASVGITERAVQRIVSELEAGGYLTRERTGRRNHYLVHVDAKLRHPASAHKTVRDMLTLLLTAEDLALFLAAK
jgi:DNA-binding MarR family transcriptional regulator